MKKKLPNYQNHERTIDILRKSLSNTPVMRAWVFGSFARKEELPESDIDLLVQFLPNSKISLFDYGGIVFDLEQSTGRRIDMIQEHMLKPFAQASANQDKILIYERTNT